MRPGPAVGPGGDPTAGAGANVTRNALRFLTSASGLAEGRLFVVPKLEMWIMNPKVGRTAQELLMAVAMNCTGQSPGQDLEVIQNFLKLRFKNKANINLFLACVKEMVNANREANLPTLIKVRKGKVCVLMRDIEEIVICTCNKCAFARVHWHIGCTYKFFNKR